MLNSRRTRPLLAISVAAAACGGDPPKPPDARVAAVAAADTIARAAAALPATGRWDEGHLVERLVRGGMAPVRLPGVEGAPFMEVPVLAFTLGRATLYAYVYPDSTARRRVSDGLDAATAAPSGAASPYPIPRTLVMQGNLAAVLVGGTDRTVERVRLAIEAGLPVAP